MKPRQNLRLIHYPVYLMMLVLCSAMGLANADEVIREVGTGSINWSQGVVYAVGYGTARSDTSPAQKRILSERAAVVDAQRNLLEMTQGVRITSVLTTNQAMQESREVATRVAGIIKGAQVTKRHYHNDVATVTMAMPIAGRFLQTVLPRALPEESAQEQSSEQTLWQSDQAVPAAHLSQYQIVSPSTQRARRAQGLERVEQMGKNLLALLIPPANAAPALVVRDDNEARAYRKLLEWMRQSSPRDIDAALITAIQNYETNSQFSGLLIDASTVPNFELATVPKIRDQDGNILYPSDNTSYDDIINKRGVTYDFDLNDAVRNHRVATTPFIIRAISTYKNLASDLIINTSDAARVKQSASTLEAMNKAGVLIVVAI
ncbi:MAG: hypothetical protein ACI90G_002466 [Urechidicola sp.]|jgi:hypothetical protein